MRLNQIKSTCTKINAEINSLRGEISDKMVKKFGMKIDFDEMEETVLTRLLTNQSKNCEHTKKEEQEIRKLNVRFFFQIFTLAI